MSGTYRDIGVSTEGPCRDRRDPAAAAQFLRQFADQPDRRCVRGVRSRHQHPLLRALCQGVVLCRRRFSRTGRRPARPKAGKHPTRRRPPVPRQKPSVAAVQGPAIGGGSASRSCRTSASPAPKRASKLHAAGLPSGLLADLYPAAPDRPAARQPDVLYGPAPQRRQAYALGPGRTCWCRWPTCAGGHRPGDRDRRGRPARRAVDARDHAPRFSPMPPRRRPNASSPEQDWTRKTEDFPRRHQVLRREASRQLQGPLMGQVSARSPSSPVAPRASARPAPETLAREGASVLVTDVDDALGKAVVERIAKAGGWRTTCATTCATRAHGRRLSPRPRSLQPARHHGRQCRHRHHGADRKYDARRLAAPAGDQPDGVFLSIKHAIPALPRGRRLDRADVVDRGLRGARPRPPIRRPRAACACSPSRWRWSMPPTTSAATRSIPASSPRRSGARSRPVPKATAAMRRSIRASGRRSSCRSRASARRRTSQTACCSCARMPPTMTGQELVIDGGITAGGRCRRGRAGPWPPQQQRVGLSPRRRCDRHRRRRRLRFTAPTLRPRRPRESGCRPAATTACIQRRTAGHGAGAVAPSTRRALRTCPGRRRPMSVPGRACSFRRLVCAGVWRPGDGSAR